MEYRKLVDQLYSDIQVGLDSEPEGWFGNVDGLNIEMLASWIIGEGWTKN